MFIIYVYLYFYDIIKIKNRWNCIHLSVPVMLILTRFDILNSNKLTTLSLLKYFYHGILYHKS